VDSNKLREIAQLRDSGILTEAEFENEKQRLLNTESPTLSSLPADSPPFPNQQAYNAQGNMGYNPYIPQEQTGMIVASYICAVVSLLFCPLVLGIMGMVLGFYAKSQGDDRGTLAGIVSLICMIIGMVIGIMVWNDAMTDTGY